MLTPTQSAEIEAIAAALAALDAAVESHLSGQADSIQYSVARASAWEVRIGALADSLPVADEPDLVATLAGLRARQKWIRRLLASPERWGSALDASLAALAVRRGEDGGVRRRGFQRYMVVQGDTLQSIAQTHLGDAERWHEIALANGLSYPYIAGDGYDPDTQATGEVTFSHASIQDADYIIPAGCVVAAASTDGREQITFVTTADVTIPAGEASAVAPVRAVAPGVAGNVGPGAISSVVELAADKLAYDYVLSVEASDVAGNVTVAERTFTHLAWPSVTNTAATSGGAAAKVAAPGEWLLLPMEFAGQASMPNILQSSALDADLRVRAYGADLDLSEDGDLAVDVRGDLRMVRGLDNLAVVARMACLVERGDLTWAPDYGSELYRVVGDLRSADLETRVTLAIRDAVLADGRFKDVRLASLEVDGGVARVGIEYESADLRDTGTLILVAPT